MDEFEIKIVEFFGKIGGKKTDEFLAFVNSISFLLVFWIAIFLVAILKHPSISNSFGLAIILVAILHFTITEGIFKHTLTKVFSIRKRPYVGYPERIKSVGRKFSDTSFPSSHMTTTVAMATVIITFFPSLFWILGAFILLMAFSRLHNGMHYPSDILFGIFLGYAYAQVALRII